MCAMQDIPINMEIDLCCLPELNSSCECVYSYDKNAFTYGSAYRKWHLSDSASVLEIVKRPQQKDTYKFFVLLKNRSNHRGAMLLLVLRFNR